MTQPVEDKSKEDPFFKGVTDTPYVLSTLVPILTTINPIFVTHTGNILFFDVSIGVLFV